MARKPTSMWPWFPRVLAEGVRQLYPDLWAKHGTGGDPPTRFTGDDAYRLWAVLRARDRSHPEWEAAQEWARQRREQYFSRHQNDYRPGGIIAAIKWGGVLPMRKFRPGANLQQHRDVAIQMMLDALDGRETGTLRRNPWVGPWEGLSAARDLSTFPQHALAMGTKVELEHTPDRRLAQRIAADHLVESPHYYEALARMERELEARANPGGWEMWITDPGAVHVAVRDEMADAVNRATRAGGVPPYTYVGAGAKGIVLRDRRGLALKVGRLGGDFISKWGVSGRDLVYGVLEAEYEWLRDAATVWPSAVVPVYEFDPRNVVVVKAYVEGHPYGWAPGSVWDRHLELCRRMEDLEWGSPEYKDDSYIQTPDGPVLVDADGPPRLGSRLARFIGDWLGGRRPEASLGGMRDLLPFFVRREVAEGTLPRRQGDAILHALRARGIEIE